jgi:hypothetical protein
MLAAAIGALVVVALAVGAYLVLSQRFMVMSKQDMATPPASAASGQAGGMAMASTVSPEISPSAEAMAAMPTATSTLTDTPSPTSVPPTDTPTPQAALPTSTVEAVQVTVAPTASPLPDTPTPEPPTPTPAPTATKAPAATATKMPTAKPVATAAPAAPAVPGLITGFEQWGVWKRGDQAYGTFAQSTQEAHSGSASGRLDYNFPAVNDNYVVFASRPPLAIPGTPTALSIWVLGDGSGHFLNVWVQDSQGEVRQFPFGTITGAGSWQQLTASLDTTAAWPQTHISGADNGKLDYPIKLYALVLDGVPDGVASRGTIYLDDIKAVSGN